jgi:hypothetical protein
MHHRARKFNVPNRPVRLKRLADQGVRRQEGIIPLYRHNPDRVASNATLLVDAAQGGHRVKGRSGLMIYFW